MNNMTPTSPTDRPAAMTRIDSELQRKFIEEFAKTHRQALEKAPEEQIGIMHITWIMSVFVGVLGGYILSRGETAFGFGAIVVGVVGFIFAMYFLQAGGTPGVRQPTPPTAEPSGGQWSRVIAKLPIPSEKLNELNGRLQHIRGLAKMRYSELLGRHNLPANRIVPERVRINVFLPDTHDAIYGEACVLFIPERLHYGMKDEEEKDIKFRPGEGLTGYVFATEKAFGALRDSVDSNWQQIYLEGSIGIGDEGYPLTMKQKRLIHSELRWIVSFPLKVTLDNVAQTFGILNVDGLTEPLTPDEMQAIYFTLKDPVEQFACDFSELDKRRIIITVEDIKAAPAA